MTDEVENLVLEHLRAIRADIPNVKEKLRGVKTERTALRLEGRAMSARIEQVFEGVAGIRVRLDRVENRLGLVDAAK